MGAGADTTTEGRDLAERYGAVRDLTETLAGPLSAEDQTAQSMADVSPTKWHRAHTTWFFEEFVLGPNAPGYEPFHPQFRYLFNSYYEAVGPRHPRPQRGVVTRPGIAEVAAYRTHVDAAMVALLQSDAAGPVADLVELGLHHEQQHQELLLMDIKHVLSHNVLDPAYRAPVAPPSSGPAPADGTAPWTEHEGGLHTIGAPAEGFAFDNERPRHATWLEPFAIATRPVTVGEVLAFIDDGGYGRSELWLSDGWAALNEHSWTAPLYWRSDDGDWSIFTLTGRHPLTIDEPACHLSYYEADAIARWSGARLPSEAEWEVAARSASLQGNHLDLDRLHPRPAASPTDHQWFGDVWEWTSSAYLPYPGFHAAPGAVGEYNGKFMVNQHVLRGGACVTPVGHVRGSYRNFFPPGSRWAFSGLRLARDAETA